ncbi:MAG: 3-keto-disaccharide hydrolase [Planctomycetota bacterium]|jgi:hypothetical protein
MTSPHPTRRTALQTIAATTVLSPLARTEGATDVEPGYTPLFDGRSLDGWHTNAVKSAHGTGGRWGVEGGALVGEQEPPGSGNGGVLLTDRRFADFDLRLELKPDWGPDTGVFFRCAEDGSSLQMYVDYHENGNVGHLAGEGRARCPMKPFKLHAQLDDNGRPRGFTTSDDDRLPGWADSVADIYENSCQPKDFLNAWRFNEWNTARILCVGEDPRITTWVNGVKICEFDSATTQHKLFDKDKIRRVLGRSGHIGLQVHGGKGWPKGARCRWRNIRIKEV